MNIHIDLKSEKGQGLVEYALVVLLIGLVASLSLRATGKSTREIYCDAISGLGGQGCSCTSTFDEPSEIDEWSGSQKEEYLSIENGKVCNSGPKKTFLNPCSLDIGSANFTAEISDVSIEKTGIGNTGFDFMFRSQDNKNGYHFTYNSRAHIVRFWKRVDGKWIQLNSTKVPKEWSEEPELDFEVKVNGDTFSAHKDGELVLQATDDAYAKGVYGLRNKPGSKTCVGGISLKKSP